MRPHSPLIQTDELASRLASVTVLDIRWSLAGPPGHEEYLRGHIPGASYVDLETDLADPPGDRGRHPLPDPVRFTDAMRRAGVSDERPVVVYDDVFGTSATRAWWLLRYYGHWDVRVLDGGYSWWRKDGCTIEHGEPGRAPGDFAGEPGHLAVLDADGAGRVAREGVLVDARAGERFLGEVEPVDPVAGHIPGAVNVPTDLNLVAPAAGSRGKFRPHDDLVISYAGAGVRTDREVGVYCGSGVTATHGVFSLALIGVSAALYPGSWSEWVTDPRREVAMGR